MAVPTLITELSTTPASNSTLVDDSTAVNAVDNHLRAVYAFIASVYANSGNGWASPYLTASNPSYSGTLTGGTGVVNLGSGQFYKGSGGDVGIGTTSPATRFHVAGAGSAGRIRASSTDASGAWCMMVASSSTRNEFSTSGHQWALVIDGVDTFVVSTDGALFIRNVGSTPATPTGGGTLFVQSGALKFIGSSGTVTTIAPA